jgi:hypothetical protein
MLQVLLLELLHFQIFRNTRISTSATDDRFGSFRCKQNTTLRASAQEPGITPKHYLAAVNHMEITISTGMLVTMQQLQ